MLHTGFGMVQLLVLEEGTGLLAGRPLVELEGTGLAPAPKLAAVALRGS